MIRGVYGVARQPGRRDRRLFRFQLTSCWLYSSVIFFAVNENETMTNVGKMPATYLVLKCTRR